MYVFRCKTSHNGFSLDTAEVFSVPLDSEIENRGYSGIAIRF